MSDKKKLIGLNYEEYEHPKDKNALDALSAIPGVDSVTKKIFEKYLDKELFFNVLASGIEVTRDNEPRLHSLLSSCCAVLDIHEIPPLYIGDDDLSQTWAITTCVNNPLIVLGQNPLERLSDEELMFLLGHELGHIKSAHLLYRGVANNFKLIKDIANQATFGLPLAQLLSAGVEIALMYWYRMSELTADRAGLLCCQDISTCIDVLIKFCDFPSDDCSSIPYLKIERFRESFIKQAKTFQNIEESGPISKFIRMNQTADRTHPWTILRASELLDWHDTGAYKEVLDNENRSFSAKINKSSKFCPNCGASIPASSKFCGGCGTVIS